MPTATLDHAGRYFEDLGLGMEASYAKTVTAGDIDNFAQLSGDTNPLHLDEKFAARTRFGGRIAHGMLTASFLSTILGTRLPGPGAIYLSQSLNFRAPVRVGDTVTARVRIVALCAESRRATLECECLVGDKTVVDGEAVVLVPSRPS